ncbi:type VII secretion protein EssB [Isobaculum melis]|uniref:Type VII secretion protein EssB n=1 Tax=Isobaculum melis TaxID=142588 RepID=A0A1H9QD39_9LACT|nr:type VII secretion protein EssB [Isobaculum melis]SER58330.1 type VII secretion protein EssB [Isobaculum melis]
MSTKENIQFEQQTYTIEKTPESWTVQIKKSDIRLKKEAELNLLLDQKDLFMPVSMTWQEDDVQFVYTPIRQGQSFDEVKQLSSLERLRVAMNLAKYESLVGQCYTFFLDPANLQFDQNLLPQLAYRGLTAGLPPAEVTEEKFLRQYQSIVVTLFSKKLTFADLYNGNLERTKENAFVKEVIAKKSVAEIVSYIETQYEKAKKEAQQKMKVVPKRKFMLYKQLTIWLTVVVLLLAIPLGYLTIFSMPHQNRLLAADSDFLKADYEGVITQLKPIETKNIDKTQKYILAYSYLQGKDLTDAQKATIMKNLSLKSADDYLTYWIENGRGNLDEAIDIAQKLEEPHLLLYAYMQKMEQIKNDPALSGQTKQEEQEKYQQKYDAIEEKYSKEEEKEGSLLEEEAPQEKTESDSK